jgi:hypothetical protein
MVGLARRRCGVVVGVGEVGGEEGCWEGED